MSATDFMAVITPFLVLAGVMYSARDRRTTAVKVAAKVEQTATDLAILVDGKADELAVKTEQIHVLVNSRLTEALDRIALLEQRLGLEPGEEPEPHERSQP